MPNNDLRFAVLLRYASSRGVSFILLLMACSLAACNFVPNSAWSMANELLESLRLEIMLQPQYYNLPSNIAGYKVLTVQTARTTACIPAGEMQVTLQATAPDVQSFLASSNPQDVMQALNQIDPNISWSIDYAGPAYTFAGIASEIRKWNAMMATGCVKLGGPIGPTVTPAP